MIETIVKVDGMMCGMCEGHINDAIRSHFQVKKVSSSHSKGQTVIRCRTAALPRSLRASQSLQTRSSTPPATRPWTWCPVPWKSAACWAT